MRLAFTCALTLTALLLPAAAGAQLSAPGRGCEPAAARSGDQTGQAPAQRSNGLEATLLAAARADRQNAARYIDLGRCYYAEELYDDATRALSQALEIIRTGRQPIPAVPARPRPTRTGGTAPRYPDSARRTGLTGIVFVEVHIGTDGRVRRARVVGSVPEFDDAALAAVEDWTFEPTIVDGTPVEVDTVLRLKFSPTPDSLPTDAMDVGRFAYGRHEYADAETALTQAISMVEAEHRARDAFAREVAAAARSDQDGVVVPACRVASPDYQTAPNPRRVTGDTVIEVLIRVDGSVVPIRVVRALDPALDAAALQAAAASHCLGAGTRHGVPVPVVVTLAFTWHLPE